MKKISILKGHKSMINALAYNSSNACLASGSSDKKIIIWDLSSKNNEIIGKIECKGWVLALKEINEELFCSGGSDDCVSIWNWKNQNLIKTLSFSSIYNILSIEFVEKYKAIVAGDRNGFIFIWKNILP